ncbi:oxidoreductase [Acidobacteria bacterium ACD]|nr:MAG: oxidoreductase [Acidobacteriota bacterium]MCE7956955.1 oxidoreductase [Acidobacteria bacterium ACB2]MDL1951365.1 oxidoreductase [Acidobacteria bacterium ACD]
MSGKPKLAVYWAASCGGCDISTLAIDEKVLAVAEAFDLVMWPCVMDGKVSDVEALPDGAIAVCLWNGGVRSSEHEAMARLFRRKSQVLVAFGSCAHEGCIPGLANLHDRESIFRTAYQETPSTENPKGVRPQTKTEVPEGTLHLPFFYDTLKTLDQTVPVDYTLPGCPPEAERIWDALTAILEGKLPPKGAVIGAQTTVCDDCSRKRSEKKVKKLHRVWQVIPDEETCLLEQGIVCAGIATRAGCGALCPKVNSPCIGCYGPNEGVKDFGARLMAGISSVIDSSDPKEVDRILAEGIPDPVGTYYRFGLAHSFLRRSARVAPAGAK